MRIIVIKRLYRVPRVSAVLVGLACLMLATGCATTSLPPGERDGQVHVQPDGQILLWDAEARRWLETEAYWLSFAERGPGRHWPASSVLPPPEEVGERDKILLRNQMGSCLMYFSHGRWRRANDVLKWSEDLDHFGGCPHVFDTHVLRD